MNYLTSLEFAEKNGVSKRWVNDLCAAGKLAGARKEGTRWLIPEDAGLEAGGGSAFERAPLPIGVSSFPLAISDYYYVDKTLLIRDLLDYRPQVSLFLRPRRFGKTLNMDMLRVFFERSETDTSEYFLGTNIWKEDVRYRQEQGKYPVIFFTFKDIKFNRWSDTFLNLKSVIQSEYRRHIKLLQESALAEADRRYIDSVLDGSLEDALWTGTLGKLTELLHTAGNVPAMVMIDEYDTPIQQGHLNGFYDDVILFMRNFLSGGLKDNRHLAMAFLTGILRVAKESIFSGLNNLNINSVLEKRYSEYFGFTEKEVKKLLRDYGRKNRFAVAKEWYDGYRFGDTEIYNPWSVISFVNEDCEPRAYWQSTGSNEIIGEVIGAGGAELSAEIQGLLSGGTHTAYLDTALVYPEITSNPSSVYSFLLMAGYLTTSDSRSVYDGNTIGTLRIPNREITVVYEKEILSRPGGVVAQGTAIAFQQTLLSGEPAHLQGLLEKFLQETISFHDASAEGFYHGLLLGMSAMLYPYYEVKSNRESGSGRYDICLCAREAGFPHFIIEVKTVSGAGLTGEAIPKRLRDEAQKALKQIDEKDYGRELSGEVKKIGVAFYKKRCHVTGS